MDQDPAKSDFFGGRGRPLSTPRPAGNMMPPYMANFDSSKFPMPQRPGGRPMGHGNPEVSPHLYGYRPMPARGGFLGFPGPPNMHIRSMEMPLGNNPPSGFDLQMPRPHQSMMNSMPVMEDHYGQSQSMPMPKSRGFGQHLIALPNPMTPTSNHMFPMPGPVMQMNPMGGLVLDSMSSDDQFSSLLAAAAPTRSFPLAINAEGDRYVARGLVKYFGEKYSCRLRVLQKAVFSHESMLRFLFAIVDKSLLLDMSETGNNGIEEIPIITTDQVRSTNAEGRAASRFSESGSAVSAPKRGRPRLAYQDAKSSNFKSDIKKGSSLDSGNTTAQTGDSLDYVKSRLKEHGIPDSSSGPDAFTDVSFAAIEVQKASDPSRLEELVVGLAAIAKENLIRAIAANITRKKSCHGNDWEVEESITPLDFQKWLFSVAENESPASMVGMAAREIVNQKPAETTPTPGSRDLV